MTWQVVSFHTLNEKMILVHFNMNLVFVVLAIFSSDADIIEQTKVFAVVDC